MHCPAAASSAIPMVSRRVHFPARFPFDALAEAILGSASQPSHHFPSPL